MKIVYLYYITYTASTVLNFARSDAAATIYFKTQVYAAFIRERHLSYTIESRDYAPLTHKPPPPAFLAA